MKRLLCIISGMNAGGAETFLMKIYRKIDNTKYQMDFCINVSEKCFYEDEINALGGKIYRIPAKSENLAEFKRQLSDLVKQKQYTSVLRLTSNAMGFWDLKIAKEAGAKRCCVRSTNSSDGNSLKVKVAHILGRALYDKYVDRAFAPSDLAAIYTFGKRAYDSGKVKILHNAVDLDYYQYDLDAKQKICNEFYLPSDCFIVGHVGRFAEQKNHLFLADIFKSVKEKNDKAVLLLVGDGNLKEEVEQKFVDFKILDSVIFAGTRSDIPTLLSAMDVFVFPSFYEGMPNTVIEAQATGLPCVISDTITKDCNITDLVSFVSLKESAEHWANRVLHNIRQERMDTKQYFIDHKYDISSSAEEFIKIVFE